MEYYYPENKISLIEEQLQDEEMKKVDWLFWNVELEDMAEYKVAEGYMGPYNYVYVYNSNCAH